MTAWPTGVDAAQALSRPPESAGANHSGALVKVSMYEQAICVLARAIGRLAESGRPAAQEVAYLAEAQERLEDSARLVAQLRQQKSVGPPRRVPQEAAPAKSGVTTQTGVGSGPLPVADHAAM